MSGVWGSVDKTIFQHGDSIDGRNLLTVFGVSTVSQAMAIIHSSCQNGNFSELAIGDYLDLPSLTVDGTLYTWNDTYQNLRIIISGFNQYKGCGTTENTNNHILWTFKNCILQKTMNSSSSNAGGYAATSLKTYLDGVFATGLNTAIGGYLYTVSRAISIKGSTAWAAHTVFPPTEVEIWGLATNGEDQIAYNTNIQFPIFSKSSFYRCKRYNGVRAAWWTCTPYTLNTAFCTVMDNGSGSVAAPLYTGSGVAPAFCTN